MAERPGTIKIEAVSYETMALGTELSFPPPLAERSGKPDTFEFWWKLMQFVYDLPLPASFPALPRGPKGADRDALDRYMRAADEMAESAVLAGNDRMTVHISDDDESETVDTDFSSGELTRGFTTLFRQFHSQKERASFLQAQRILRGANDEADDEHVQERREQLGAWGKARSSLLVQNLKVRVGQKLIEEGKMPPGIPGEDASPPEQLIRTYQYGDLIHWGDQRSDLEAVAEDPFFRARQRMLFLDAVAGLTHLYLGFSLVIRAALRGIAVP